MRMSANNGFLDSFKKISSNQAEYSVLYRIYDDCADMYFLLELSELELITYRYGEIIKYIISNYRTFDVRCFSVTENANINDCVEVESGGADINDEILYNKALKKSELNKTYILAKTKNSLVLFFQGKFDSNFDNYFADRNEVLKSQSKKFNIDQLDEAFEHYQIERKYRGCDYIVGRKVCDQLSEQMLRNHLVTYLTRNTNMHVVVELCTSIENDEESVDIGVINSDSSVAIIEVKFFVEKEFFQDKGKPAYSFSRFKDGYEQLNKYCIHLNKDNYKLHSAFLYMFYAHSDEKEKVLQKCNHYLDEFRESPGCSIEFQQSYRNTILDNMVEEKITIQ